MEKAFTVKQFDELTTTELYQILKLRSEVFVVEQNCVYLDQDDLDFNSYHLMQQVDGLFVGYTRLLPPGLDFEDAAAIGRVITAPKLRRKGYGRPLMKESIRICRDLWPERSIKIHAQSYLLNFYREFGFNTYGSEFLEDGIPHWFMELPAAT